MSRYAYIGILVVFALSMLVLVVDTPRPAAASQAYEALEGSLYSGDMSVFRHASLDLAQDGAMPEVPLAFDDVSPFGLAAGTNRFIVNVVTAAAAKWSFTTRGGSNCSAAGGAANGSSTSAHHGTRRRGKSATGEVAVSSTTVTVSTETIHPAPAPHKPVESFITLNNALEGGLVTYPLTARIKRGDIVLTLEKVGKVDPNYLIRFSVANNEKDEFFLSKILIFADGEPIVSREYMPFSCRSSELVYGIVRFAAADVKGKKVGFTLTESGNGARKYEIKSIEYGF